MGAGGGGGGGGGRDSTSLLSLDFCLTSQTIWNGKLQLASRTYLLVESRFLFDLTNNETNNSGMVSCS